MDYWLSEEQCLFRDSINRFLTERYPLNDRLPKRSDEQVPGGPCRDGDKELDWRAIADLGWLAAPFPEVYGGLDGSTTDMALVMEQLGQSLLPCPYLSTVVLGGSAILYGGTEAQKKEILGKVATGDIRLAVALAESDSDKIFLETNMHARKRSGEFKLSGTRRFVIDAESADFLLVPARTDGAPGDCDGLSLFLIPRCSSGLRVDSYRMRDGTHAATLHLDSVRVGADAVIGRTDGAAGLLQRVFDTASAMICMEAVGAMWAAFDCTLNYLKVRSQFDKTIGSFQALQHRMVDAFTKCQMSQSITMGAVAALEGAHAGTRARLCSAAKLKVNVAARDVGEECLQLHGGIGMTAEYPVGHFLKRLTTIRATFGNDQLHMQRYRDFTDREKYAVG